MTVLLATKLRRPPLPATWVRRPYLSQRLDEGLVLNRQITLVSAPAGFGKTSCVSEWVAALDRPVAWLSLDPADDDPGRFIGYLVAALQAVDPNLGQAIEGVLRSGQLPPSEVVGATLINDIMGTRDPFLLVLDDVHVIQDRFIFQVLDALIANPPPLLHLVLITREDPPLPLARLRASNRLTEIRARDLRFAGRDSERFLNEAMGLSLSQADVTVLEHKTEGWIAGLQLAALAIQSQPGPLPARDRVGPSDFIAALSGSHRFILGYLTEEVLSQQPDEVQRFLLQTAILEELNPDLCNAVTGRSDSRALLEQLLNANLFLIPLDDEGQWYRYHHLFADLLRDRQVALPEDETAELHRRASRWCAQAGEAFAGEAIQHALAAQDDALAVELLERHAMDMIMQGYAKTMHGWVQAIPDEWTWSSPRTNLAFAWMHLLRGAYAQAAPHLERAQAAFAGSQAEPHLDEGKRSLKAEWLVMQSLFLNMEGRMAESKAAAIQALEIVPAEDSRVRSLAHFGLACACQAMDEYERAVDAYQVSIQYGRAAGNVVTEMLSTSALAELALDHGQLHLAFEIADAASTRLARSSSLPPISTVVYGILGEVYYQWVQVEEARRYTLRALQLSTLGGYNSGMIGCRVFLSRLSQLGRDLEDAAREIQQAVELMQVDTPDYIRQETVAQQARVYLARNRPAAAEMALQGQGFSFQDGFSYPDPPSGQSIFQPTGLLYNSSLCIILHQARAGRDLANLRPGIELADRLIAGALQGQSLLLALEALLLRAQMHDLLGDNEASQADYARALELAEPEGIVGVFVEQGAPVAEALAKLAQHRQLGTLWPDHVARILAAFPGPQPPGSTPHKGTAPDLPAGAAAPVESEMLVEPLTDRELDVLRLIAKGLKYREIAAQLYISLNTVRFHVKAVYGKLGVNNRRQAVEKARELQVL
jgi:LuxR family maltose regulon positive regulatory protein